MVLFVLNRKEKENRKATLHVSPSGCSEIRILLLGPRLLFHYFYDRLRKTHRVFTYSRAESCHLPQNREKKRERRRARPTAYRRQDERGEGPGVAVVDDELDDILGSTGHGRRRSAGVPVGTEALRRRQRCSGRPSARERGAKTCAQDDEVVAGLGLDNGRQMEKRRRA
jgi:hypothetical protein